MITINFNQFEYPVATCPAAGMASVISHPLRHNNLQANCFFEANWTAI